MKETVFLRSILHLIAIITFNWIFSISSFGQIEELKLVEEHGFSNLKVVEVQKVFEKALSLTIEVNFSDFDFTNKSIFVEASVLNKYKSKTSLILTEKVVLENGQADFVLKFDNSRKAKSPIIETRFVQLEIFESLGIGDYGISKGKYIYSYEKKWGPFIVPPKKLFAKLIGGKTPKRYDGNFQGSAFSFRETIDKVPQGPLESVNLNGIITSAYEFRSPSEVLNIYPQIYQDKNPESGYFYYLPASYSLKWDDSKSKNCGYYFSSGYVADEGYIIKAELNPVFTRTDLVVLKEMLKAKFNGQFQKLVPIPLATTPDIQIADLSNFRVDESSISLDVFSSFSESIKASWQFDKLEFLEIFKRTGATGKITFTPEGLGRGIEIPLSIDLSHESTYGHFELELRNLRTNRWQNPVGLPIKVTAVHLLLFERSHNKLSPFVYSWDLGGVALPRNHRIPIDISSIPTFLDNQKNVQKVWISYELIDCEECKSKVWDCVSY